MTTASISPRWLPKASHVLASGGAGALALGLIFLTAFNWADLNKFLKFAFLEGLIAALVAGALLRGLNNLLSKGLLVLAAGCLGPLLAVFGQTYQTGADVWQLFAGWAGLSLVWALVARSSGGWLLWIGLAQTALWLNLNTFFDLNLLSIGSVPLWIAVAGINGMLLVAWEFCAKKLPWLDGRLAPRLIAAVLLFAVTATVISSLFFSSVTGRFQPFVMWALLVAGGHLWYGRGQRDIVIATFGWIAVASVALSITVKLLADLNPILTTFIAFFTVLGLMWFGVRRLRKNFLQSDHWVVSVAAGFGAWLCMVLLISFFALLFGGNLAQSAAFWLVGCLACGVAAVRLSIHGGENAVFRQQLTNVLALAAPSAAYIGIFLATDSGSHRNGFSAVYLSSGAALALWFFLRSKQTRSLMAIVAMYGVVAFFSQIGLDWATVWIFFGVACAVWLAAPNSFLTDADEIERAANDSRIQRLTEMGYGATLWVLLLVAGMGDRDRMGHWYALWDKGDRADLAVSTPLWLPATIGLVIALLALFMLVRAMRKASLLSNGLNRLTVLSDPLSTGFTLLAAALAAWYAPYLLIGITFLCIGLGTVRLKLTILAVFGIFLALFEYYFELATPLWTKGLVLGVVGILLLLIAWRVVKGKGMNSVQPSHGGAL
jgi:uncharacterized membrane protein